MPDILWEDEHLVAVAKPAGLATVPGRGEPDSLLEQMPGCRIVHRLDKETSGVLLLAKDAAAQAELGRQFYKRLVKKEYLALVAGTPTEESGEIDAPIGPHPRRKKIMHIVKNAKPSFTRWEVAQRLGPFTLLRCFPRTGRRHQIRVHLKSIGLPLAVDPAYNRPPRGTPAGIFLSSFKRNYHGKDQERPLIGRLSLHALRLSFADLNGKPIVIECEPPKDFRAVMNMLAKYAKNVTM
jgi:23S rRNA pseudouridine1911/1915/1917 synthase